VNPETAGELASAGQALSGSKVAAEDTENNLGKELFANGYRAAASEPQLHGDILDQSPAQIAMLLFQLPGRFS
jgi:hypothetical protein